LVKNGQLITNQNEDELSQALVALMDLTKGPETHSSLSARMSQWIQQVNKEDR
jgi:hypothetical protein